MYYFIEDYFIEGSMRNPYNISEPAEAGEPGLAISLDPGTSVKIFGKLDQILGEIGNR